MVTLECALADLLSRSTKHEKANSRDTLEAESVMDIGNPGTRIAK